MSFWFSAITRDITKMPECIHFYENELVSAQSEVSLKGKSIEKHAAELPGITQYRFSQLQEIESILEYLNILLNKEKARSFKHFLEGYQKALTSRDAEKYSMGDQSVIDMLMVVNEFALLRNKYLAIHKGLEQKSWMIGHITRIRCAGLDDFRVE